MSGLGDTIASGGEQGIDNAATPIPTGTSPDAPQQIAQTTSTITLPVLQEKDWIHKATYTVSTEMPPGTVFAIIPNHPSQCNYVTNHIHQLFNTWCGVLSLRFRLLATAFYGGSIRAAILPPNFSETEISNFSLATLTAYANTDFDPKNTVWNHISATDQREYAFHYNKPYDTNDPKTFGGYIVFFIAGKLVTQSPEISTIQMLVESRGGYIYDQPRPLATATTIDDPLRSILPLPLRHHALSEVFAACDTLVVLDQKVLKTTYGNIMHSGVGKMAMQEIDFPGRSIDNKFQFDTFYSARDANAFGPPRIEGEAGFIFHPSSLPTMTDAKLVLPNEQVQMVRYHGDTSTGSKFVPEWPVFKENATGFNIQQGKEGLQINATKDVFDTFNKGISDTNFLSIKATVEPMRAPSLQSYPMPNTVSGCSFAPQAGGESIIVFGDSKWGMTNTQTGPITLALSEYKTDQTLSNKSWVYQMVNKNGTPILNIRLNPNGMFTTNRTSANVTYPIDQNRLRFLQELPLSSPLPPMSVAMQAIRSELTFNGRTKSTTALLAANIQAVSSY